MMPWARRTRPLLALGALVVLLGACSSTPQRPKPAELAPLTPLIAVRQAWTLQLGPTEAGLNPHVVGQDLVLVNSAGAVTQVSAATGQPRWRVETGASLATGAGSDGRTTAVITDNNELLALAEGQVRWRARLAASAHTAPLVAGGRVFVTTADRSVQAFDANTGARLWTQTRSAEALVLRHPGVLLAVGDTLVVGWGGRLAGLDPNSGRVRWDVALANPRGTNDIERLVDLTGPASRVGNSVCVRAFSAAVGCVDVAKGTVGWTTAANGATGLTGHDSAIFGAESDGRVRAWQRDNGKVLWTVERLRWRQLSAPLAVGRVVASGDETGTLHLLSREDGSDMARLTTDGSPLVGAPLVVGDALVVQTRKGGVFAWFPQ